jgi:hypothetical protein
MVSQKFLLYKVSKTIPIIKEADYANPISKAEMKGGSLTWLSHGHL